MLDPVLYLVLSEPVLLRHHLLHPQPLRRQVPQHDHGRGHRAGSLHAGVRDPALVWEAGTAVRVFDD